MSFFDETNRFDTHQMILDELYAVCPVCKGTNMIKHLFSGRITVRCIDCEAKINAFYNISLGNPYNNRITAF
jgi:hypothetical protein